MADKLTSEGERTGLSNEEALTDNAHCSMRSVGWWVGRRINEIEGFLLSMARIITGHTRFNWIAVTNARQILPSRACSSFDKAARCASPTVPKPRIETALDPS